jgi:hypothetical protein
MDCPGLSMFTLFHSWRRMRRVAQEALTKTAVQRYHPTMTKEATILASTFLSDPKNRDQHFLRAVASTMLSILYDFPTLTSTEDKIVQDVQSAVNSAVRAAVGTSLVELFPWMIYVPQRSRLFSAILITHLTSKDRFAKWKREALQRSSARTGVLLRLFNRVKADIVCPLIQIYWWRVP